MMEQQKFNDDFTQNCTLFSSLLRIDQSFDLVRRDFYIAEQEASLFFINGFVKDEILEKMMQYLTKLTPKQLTPLMNQGKMQAKDFSMHFITHIQTQTESDPNLAVTQVLAGQLALIVDGCNEVILIDARTYPSRQPQEPDNERTLRGAHDGFGETLVVNTAMIRRRIRDPQLTMEHLSFPGCHTDIVLCYMADTVDKKVLKTLRNKLKHASTKSIHMGQESLIETLLGEQWFNPFPKVRFTERPDTAAASVQEGQVVLITDTAPQAIILPCSIFTFLQDINDFYFPPLIGTYLRWVRLIVAIVTLLLTPTWYLMTQNPDIVPEWLSFVLVENQGKLPVLMQFIIIELMLDGLKLASLNTPNALSSSFSIVGALLLGDLAITAGWFSPDVVLYMAFVAVANFTVTSFELGYALKFGRLMTLLLTAMFNYWGFAAGMILIVVQIFSVKTLAGYHYMAPLIPFNWKALSSLLVRKTKKE